MLRADHLRRHLPVGLAVAAYLVVVVVALVPAYRLREPDPYAYRAATRALAQGELTLDTAGYLALDTALVEEGDGWERQLVDTSPTYLDSAPPGGCPQRRGSVTGPLFGEPPPVGIAQWVRLDDGQCVSEKSPGYPFLVLPFDAAGLVRLGPLVWGAVGCVGIWCGARRWLGRWGAAFAVGLTSSAPAVLLMAHRAWMPSFTGALLLAGGAGFALWAVLATDAPRPRRAVVGALGFALAGVAATVRLTDLLPAIVVAAWCVAVARRPRGGRDWRLVGWWVLGAAVPAAALGGYDLVVYGDLLTSGYGAGGGGPTWEVGNIAPNLEVMPGRLTAMLPLWLLAALAVLVAVGAAVAGRQLPPRTGDAAPPRVGGDAVGAGAGAGAGGGDAAGAGVRDGAVLGMAVGWWVSVWGLYALFGWTHESVAATSHPIITARFYLPAVGALALLGAWLLARAPAVVGASVVAALLASGVPLAWSATTTGWTFDEPVATVTGTPVPPSPGPGPGPPAGPPAPGDPSPGDPAPGPP